jgi:hypothetical protein
VAMWCACGMGESLQRQRFQVWNVAFGIPITLYYSYRAGRRLSSGFALFIFAYLAARAALLFMYYHHNRRFYQEVGTCDLLTYRAAYAQSRACGFRCPPITFVVPAPRAALSRGDERIARYGALGAGADDRLRPMARAAIRDLRNGRAQMRCRVSALDRLR